MSTVAASPGIEPHKHRKLEGYDFYRKCLNSPKLVVAPMVDASELLWRMLSRRYKAELCYTPMFNARLFVEQPLYRSEQWSTCAKDRPLIVQFCANDPEILLRAAKLVENDCDGVDLNLGCPKHSAKRGHHGSFLIEEWNLISSMIKLLHRELVVPVTCKIRVYPDEQKTLNYAKMLQDSGCQLLTVHGRFREQKGHQTGLADWKIIKKIKESLSIPVFANGNILHHSDLERCLAATGCDGVMTAEGNLYNPALFTGRHPAVWEMAQEYLDICNELQYDKSSIIRGHLIFILRPALLFHIDMRDALAKANDMNGFQKIVSTLQKRLEKVRDADSLRNAENEYVPTPLPEEELDPKIYDPLYGGTYYRYAHWVCQPYIRQFIPAETEEDCRGDVVEFVKNTTQQDMILSGQKRLARSAVKRIGTGFPVVDSFVCDSSQYRFILTRSIADVNSLGRREKQKSSRQCMHPMYECNICSLRTQGLLQNTFTQCGGRKLRRAFTETETINRDNGSPNRITTADSLDVGTTAAELTV